MAGIKCGQQELVCKLGFSREALRAANHPCKVMEPVSQGLGCPLPVSQGRVLAEWLLDPATVLGSRSPSSQTAPHPAAANGRGLGTNLVRATLSSYNFKDPH